MNSPLLSLASILSITLLYSAPLIYTALGGVLSENSGVVNIGLEGMMSIGAVVGSIVGYYVGNPWIAFLCGGLGGMLIALLHAIATINFAADHVVSGIAINLIGQDFHFSFADFSLMELPCQSPLITRINFLFYLEIYLRMDLERALQDFWT